MVLIYKKKTRKNGFECPLHPIQLLTFIIFFSDLITYYLIDIICLSYNNLGLTIFLSIIYGIFSIGTLYYAIVATMNDPTDETIYIERLCK